MYGRVLRVCAGVCVGVCGCVHVCAGMYGHMQVCVCGWVGMCVDVGVRDE